MREETERAFRDLLEQHDRELLTSAGPAAERALREQEFDRRFHELTRDVAAPIMAKAKALIHDQGVQAEIVITQPRIEPGGLATPRRSGSSFAC